MKQRINSNIPPCAAGRRQPLAPQGAITALLAAALLSACAVGPNFVPPAPPALKSYTGDPKVDASAAASSAQGVAPGFAVGAQVSAQWWTLFHSPALNALVDQALRANPSLQAALASLKIAHENVYAQQGAYWPQVDASFSPTRQKVGAAIQSPLNSGATLFDLHTAQVTVSYSPDILGLNQRQVEALQADAAVQRFQYEAAYLTLTSSIVNAAIQEASLREQIAATQRIEALQKSLLQAQRTQLKLGDVAEASVLTQEALIAQTQVGLLTLQKQLTQQRDLLAALRGGYPSDTMNEKFELGDLHLPDPLPLSLPSALVEQRPDIQAASAQLHAASAQIGVAIANMLPQLTLTGSDGFSGASLAHLFSGPNAFWSVAAGVTQPIFQGTSLLHRKRGAEAAYELARAQYQQTVIGAFQNVADTLQAIHFDGAALDACVDAERLGRQGLDISLRQAQLGDISEVAVLSTEQNYQQAVIALAQARANRLADAAALFQALGGGWWNRASPTAR